MSKRKRKQKGKKPAVHMRANVTVTPANKPAGNRPIRHIGRVPVREENSELDNSQSVSDAGAAQAQAQPAEQPQEQPQEENQEEQPQEAQAEEEEQAQEEEEQPQETVVAEGEQDYMPVRFPLVSSHVKNNRLHTSAICATPDGFFLLHCKTRCNANSEGPINIGEEIEPPVRRALQAHRNILTNKAVVEKQKKYAGELVLRSREGDQNAMAIIACVRENAKGGNPIAKQSIGFIKAFIDANPMTPNVGAETIRNNEDHWASTMLANGPQLSAQRINRIGASLGPFKSDFMRAIVNWRNAERMEHEKIIRRLNEVQRQLTDIGRIIGHARAIQAVRTPGSKISNYSPNVGWELGE